MSAVQRRTLMVVVVAIALVAVAVLLWPGDDDGARPVATDGGFTTFPVTTSEAPAVPTTGEGSVPPQITAPTIPPPAPLPPIWPLDGRPAADPDALALDFARGFLGMPEARVVDSSYPTTSCCSNEPSYPNRITIEPYASGGPTTQVHIARIDGGFVVTGTGAQTIWLDSPPAGAEVSPAIRVHGSAQAYEGTVNYEVYAAGALDDLSGGDHIVMGGGDAMLDFDDVIPVNAPPGATSVVLVLFDAGARGDGKMVAATVVPLRLRR